MKKIKIFLALFVMMSITTNAFGQQETENIFSKTFKNGIPVQITNNRDKGYTIKFSNTKAPAGISVQSGSASYTTEDIWYLVGDANGFKMYSHNTGKKLTTKIPCLKNSFFISSFPPLSPLFSHRFCNARKSLRP